MTLSKIWQRVKSISYDWLPLSGMVVVVYMIQRGFAAISKAGVEGVDLVTGMSIFFTSTALSALAIGFLSDRIKPKYLMETAGIAGVIGILGLGLSPWIFGIGMGIAAAVTKMVNFSAPLKRLRTQWDAIRISPQAAAKNIGAAAFIFLFAAIIKVAGFSLFTAMIAPLWLLVCTVAFFTLERYDVRLTQWEWRTISRILKNRMFYIYGVWYAACTVAIYTIYPKVYGALKGLEYSRSESLYIMGMLALLSIPWRWVWGYVGDRTNHWWLPLAALMVYIPAIWLVPIAPVIWIPLFFFAMSMVTQNMWVVARNWFTRKDIGTAMGMIMIVSYLLAGWSFGKW